MYGWYGFSVHSLESDPEEQVGEFFLKMVHMLFLV